MKIRIFSLFAAAAFFCQPLSAVAVEKVEVKVKGMVCSFCAQGIKKKLSKIQGLTQLKVNLDDKVVHFDLAEAKSVNSVSDDQIKTAIVDSGFGVVSISRVPEAQSKKVSP